MASSHTFSTIPRSPLREEVQFPTVEPQRRPQKQQRGAQAPTMAKHGRSSSFIPSFLMHRSHNSGEDRAHQRTVSLDRVAVAGRGTGASTRTSGELANGQQFGQTQNHHSAPYPQPDTTPDAMVSQQQRNGAAAYQQPLPHIPPAGQPDSGGAGPGQSQGAAPGPVQPAPGQPAPLHPEIRSVVGLTAAHAHKIYFSGPLVRRIERQPDGQRPHKDDGWTEVWAQLGGTTLSIWDMKEVQEASRQGTEVPPIYVNITDAFIQVLGSVTVPATATSPPKRYVNVLTLNTAGSNLLLFSCPSTDALISWASALRLSAWEKSRLEEIYTAHLIRITLKNRDYPTPLARGKLEGWAQIRIAGQTDWKRVWLSISEGSGIQRSDSRDAAASPGPGHQHSGSMSVGSKNRLSKLFGNKEQTAAQSHLPTKPTIFMYSGMKPKERKKPLLTLTDVSQAFAVYPERPELIPRSTLIKVEGTLGDEEMAQSMKSREGWILIMPLMENLGPNTNQSTEMLKWVVALHDAFGLYGRPQGWTWDPRDPQSLMFGYPVGIQKELLFLDRESAEKMDPRIDRTSAIRYRLREMLIEFMRSPNAQQQPSGDPATSGPPSLPPIQALESQPNGQRASPNGSQQFQPQRFHSAGSGGPQLPQLPPLSFGDEHPPDLNRPLTPITERDSVLTHPIGTSGDNQQQSQQSPTAIGFSPRSPPQPQRQLSSAPSQEQAAPSQPIPAQNDQSTVLGRDLNQSPLAISPTQSYASTSILSGTPQLGAPTTGGGSQTSFSNADKGAMQAAARNSADSTSRTNGGATRSPLASPTKIQGSPLTHRPGGSFSSTAPSTPPPPVPKDNVSEPQTRMSEDRSMFNQHNIARTESQQPKQTAPVPAPALHASSSATDRNDDLVNEAGAMFFMQQHNDGAASQPARQQPVHFDDEDRDDYDSPSDVELSSRAAQKQRALSSIASDTTSLASSNSQRQQIRKNTPMTFADTNSGGFANDGSNRTASPTQSSLAAAATAPGYEAPSSRPAVDRGYVTTGRSALGRKPSGARAPQPTPKGFSGQVAAFASSSQLPSQYEESEDEEGAEARSSNRKQSLPAHQPRQDEQGYNMASHSPAVQKPGTDNNFDDDADTLAALAYLDVSDPPQQPQKAPPNDSSTNGGPPTVIEPLQASTSMSSDVPSNSGIKSSFAPSRQAEERKKKAQAQQAAQQAAVTKPGRANGRRRTGGAAAGAWGESSDEEEEEEEEEDDEDVDSDGEPSQAPPPPRMQQQQQQQQQQQAASMQQPFPQSSVYPSVGGVPPTDNPSTYSHGRPPRTLPQPPAGSRPGPDDFAGPRLRTNSDQYAESGRRTYFDEGAQPQPRSQSHLLAPGAARQNVWSQVLDAGAGAAFSPNESTQNNKDTFVQLDTNEKLTKAFTPQGLLSAGMQDKQDRSAKRQEELARETGASLINVPNKPPPPQTGLLGAISSHERERKREGGLGAALTEREREKRVAEERQRRFDEQQRQQLDQMQQGGSMYGAPYGFNPMMNPMMMGMNPMMGMPPMGPMAPMMTGGNMMPGQAPLAPMMTGGGMNPMMTGGGMNPMMGYGMFNPQHMFAAQQAAQAYQNAMLAFSVAGSQVGGDGANGQGPQNQGMMGGNMGGMGGFDPRMSMNLMGMPGMMGGMPMMNPGPLNAQNTGMSQFDPRFGTPNVNGTPPVDNGNLTPPNALQNLGTPGGSGHNSPVARGSSPLRQSSRPASPK